MPVKNEHLSAAYSMLCYLYPVTLDQLHPWDVRRWSQVRVLFPVKSFAHNGQ
jgi:hypothetical protein